MIGALRVNIIVGCLFLFQKIKGKKEFCDAVEAVTSSSANLTSQKLKSGDSYTITVTVSAPARISGTASYLVGLHSKLIHIVCTVNVLKFQTLVVSQKDPDKQWTPRSDCFCRSSLIRVFPVCYSDKHFVNSSLNKQHFI